MVPSFQPEKGGILIPLFLFYTAKPQGHIFVNLFQIFPLNSMKYLLLIAGQKILMGIQLLGQKNTFLNIGDTAVVIAHRDVISSFYIMHLHLHLAYLSGIVFQVNDVLRQFKHLCRFGHDTEIVAEIRSFGMEYRKILIDYRVKFFQVTNLILVCLYLIMAFVVMVDDKGKYGKILFRLGLIVGSQHFVIKLLFPIALFLVNIFLENAVDKFIIDIPSNQNLFNKEAFLQPFQNFKKGQPVHALHQKLYFLNTYLLREDRHTVQDFLLILGYSGQPRLDYKVCLRRFFKRVSLLTDNVNHFRQEKCVAVRQLI